MNNRQDRIAYRRLHAQLKAARCFHHGNGVGIALLTLEISLWCACVFLITQTGFSGAFYWLLQVFLGFGLYRCFVLVHECGHDSLFKHRTLNRVAGEVLGALSFIPATSWCYIHSQHHKWVGIVDKDPTSEGTLKFKGSSTLLRKLYRMFWILHLPIAAVSGILLFWTLPFKREGTPKKHVLAISLSVLFVLLVQTSLFLILGATAYCWTFLPALFWYLIIFEGINLCHHAGLYTLNSEMQSKNIPCYAQAPYCRTTLMPNWLSMLLCYHFTLHTEHHLFPQVPWYKLPKLKIMLAQETPFGYQTINFFAYWRRIRSADPFVQFIDTAPALKHQTHRQFNSDTLINN